MRGAGGSRDVRRGASRGTKGTVRLAGREARTGRGAARVARGVDSPDGRVVLRVCQGARGGGGQRGTLGGASSRCTDEPTLDRKGWREEVTIHVAQKIMRPQEGLGEKGMKVMREDTLPRCTEGYRLLTRRAGRGG
jgi:hypothetical protein